MTTYDPASRLASLAVSSRRDLQVMNYLVPTVVEQTNRASAPSTSTPVC